MPEEWIVRVAGKEYGPVDTEELIEWREEGRLIAENEIRRVNEEDWTLAGSVPEIFGRVAAPPPLPEVAGAARARTWPELLAETRRIYTLGLGRFVVFGLISAVPLFALRWALPKFEFPNLAANPNATVVWPTLSPMALALFLLFLALWPISTAGYQFVADDLIHGRTRSLGSQLRAALGRWGHLVATALLVYGSYLFWFLIPFGALTALVGSGQISAVGAFLFLMIAGFMVYMNARLFINFLFWQPAVTLRSQNAFGALQESKELARSEADKPRLERPLFRGAIVASVWLAVVLILSVGIQIPFLFARFLGVASSEEAITLARNLAEAKTPDVFSVLADVASAALSLVLQPLLAAAFVVLYHDARARSGQGRRDAS